MRLTDTRPEPQFLQLASDRLCPYSLGDTVQTPPLCPAALGPPTSVFLGLTPHGPKLPYPSGGQSQHPPYLPLIAQEEKLSCPSMPV